MPIDFKDGVDISDLKHTPYNLSAKDKKGIDEILDPLKKIGVIEDVPLRKLCPAAAPAFTV